MDLITDLPVTAKGHDSIFEVVDRLSKVVHIEAINKTISGSGLHRPDFPLPSGAPKHHF